MFSVEHSFASSFLILVWLFGLSLGGALPWHAVDLGVGVYLGHIVLLSNSVTSLILSAKSCGRHQ